MIIFEGIISTKNFMVKFDCDLWQCTIGVEYAQSPTSSIVMLFFGPLCFRVERSSQVQHQRMMEKIKEHEEGRCDCSRHDREFIDKVIKDIKGE